MRACPARSTGPRRARRSARRCRRCGIGSTSCRSHRQSEIGPDGHPRRGGFLPPVPLPRRMWAGSQFEFRSPLRVGDAITRISTIDEVTAKRGRRGSPVFVRVRHEVRRDGLAEPALVEFHDIVYREAPKAGDAAPPPTARASPRGLGTPMDSRRRAAVPAFGADLQRPPDPLRPPLRDRGRGVSGARRHGPLIRRCSSISCAGNGRRPASNASSSGRCARSATCIRSSCAANATGREDDPAVGT